MSQNWSITGIQLTVVKKKCIFTFMKSFFLVNFLTFIQHFESNKCKYECLWKQSIWQNPDQKKKNNQKS